MAPGAMPLRRALLRGLLATALAMTLLADPVLVVAGPMQGGPASPSPTRDRQALPDLEALAGKYVPGELLVRYKPGLPGAQVQALSVQHGLRTLSTTRDGAIHRVAVQGDLTVAWAALKADPRVVSVQPNWLYTVGPLPPRQFWPLLVPNDDLYQGGDAILQGAGPLDFQRWYFGNTLLRAEAAWDLATGRPDVVVAVIDTGVDLDHPDLAANIWTNPDEVAGNGVDDDGNGYIDDVHGWDFYSDDNNPNPDLGDGLDNDSAGGADSNTTHGTFVAGTVAAVGNDGVGVAGAAWGVKLMPLKVFTDDGAADDFGIMSAIIYAAENGADVINLSLGALLEEPVPISDPLTEELITAVHHAGLVVVVSAGNENSSQPSSPASATHAISVGASDHDSVYVENVTGGALRRDPDGRADFSNYGQYVDVVAPGVAVFTTSVLTTADSIGSGYPPGTPAWDFAVGTSFSAPLVSGLAALIISRGLDLGVTLTPDQVRAIIEGTAVDLPNDPDDVPDAGPNWDGHGRVDFYAALRKVRAYLPTSPLTAQPQTLTVVEDTPLAVTLAGSDPENNPLTFAIVTRPSHGDVTGTAPSLVYRSALNYNGSDSFTFRASDGYVESPPATVSITVTAANDAPTAQPQALTTPEDTPLAITLAGSDPENSPLTFSIVTRPSHGDVTGTAPSLTYRPAPDYNGPDSFTFTASDGALTSAPATVTITVTAVNDPTVVSAGGRTPLYTQRTWTVQVATFTDADSGDTHTATVDWGDGTVTSGVVSEQTHTVTGSHRYRAPGAYTVTVTVTDGGGTTDRDSYQVTVRPHPRLMR
ncbi:MAG: S8 family serine peptidase [Chloroflexi bacterium]|nr:S8 family serine peptidase [Chloroflexota bacterium]